MACNNGVFAFSPNADFFAYSSPDGCLKVWETCSGSLKQEYTPSSHLSTTCSTLSWGPCKYDAFSPQKKIKRAKSKRLAANIADLKLIAMGTLSGEVLLYSVTSGDLHSKMDGGHSEAVNSASWLAENDSLFTCSNDRHIVRWSISDGTVTSKWKAEKSPVHCVCVVDSDSLLSASSSIIWWDIKTQSALKKFTGHSSEVSYLSPINMSENFDQPAYFISSAIGDRVISVWHLNQDSDGNAIASFTLSDELMMLNISEVAAKSEPLIVTAVTKSGVLHIFDHQLNGKVKKPIQPKATVHIASMADKTETKSQPIPILCAKVAASHDSCYVAYGSFLKPVFEKLELEEFQKDTYLVRQNRITMPTPFEGVSKVREPDRSSGAKILAPGYMAPSKPTESVPRKKKRRSLPTDELPMEERLNAINLSKAPENHEIMTSNPSSESMIHLLLQGLQSKDNKLLNTVLRCSDESLINTTVKRLPLNSIPLLLKELHRRLSRKEQGNRPCLRWLKGLLAIHLSYLMSLQEIDEYIGPVSQLIDARSETFSKMLQLKGFLDILWSQIDSKVENSTISREPLAVIEDMSSSEGEEEEEEDEDQMDHSEHNSDNEDHAHSSGSNSEEEMLFSNDEMEDS